MKTAKCYLGKDTIQERLAAVHRLAAQGVAVSPEYLSTMNEPLEIFQIGGIESGENSVCDLSCGGSGCTLNVSIVSKKASQIGEYRLELPWPTPEQVWLDDPLDRVPPGNIYKLPGDSPEFSRDLVLNHRRGKFGRLKPNEAMDGILLAWMATPIPDLFRIGSADASLMVIDVTGKIARCRVSLVLDRSQRYAATQRGSRRQSILDEGLRAQPSCEREIAVTSQEQTRSAERQRNPRGGRPRLGAPKVPGFGRDSAM